jgi:hypothetical protein
MPFLSFDSVIEEIYHEVNFDICHGSQYDAWQNQGILVKSNWGCSQAGYSKEATPDLV